MKTDFIIWLLLFDLCVLEIILMKICKKVLCGIDVVAF